MPLADVLRQLSGALRRLRHDGGLLVAHLLENDAGLLQCELQRVEAVGDAVLLAALATEGVCTMQAAAAQQHFRGGSVAASLSPRSAEQLRQSFNHRLYAITLSNACRMYGVVQPTETEGYRAHRALFDTELAGRLYFVMRGIGHRVRGSATACAPPCRLLVGRGIDDAREAQALAMRLGRAAIQPVAVRARPRGENY